MIQEEDLLPGVQVKEVYVVAMSNDPWSLRASGSVLGHTRTPSVPRDTKYL